jgi:hypothetical protein
VLREQRSDERVELLRRTVVGVQRHEDPVGAGDLVGKRRKRAPASPLPAPDTSAAPLVVTSTMPSDSASAKLRSAALSVSDEVTFTAGKA